MGRCTARNTSWHLRLRDNVFAGHRLDRDDHCEIRESKIRRRLIVIDISSKVSQIKEKAGPHIRVRPAIFCRVALG